MPMPGTLYNELHKSRFWTENTQILEDRIIKSLLLLPPLTINSDKNNSNQNLLSTYYADIVLNSLHSLNVDSFNLTIVWCVSERDGR
jgi:hypothetical protein